MVVRAEARREVKVAGWAAVKPGAVMMVRAKSAMAVWEAVTQGAARRAVAAEAESMATVEQQAAAGEA